jgi:hypothetical protein
MARGLASGTSSPVRGYSGQEQKAGDEDPFGLDPVRVLAAVVI